MDIRKHWWKALAILLLIYVVVMGFLGQVPARPILNETIRNLYFHVPMWMSMFVLSSVAVVFAIMHLSSGKTKHDTISASFMNISLLYGLLGLITGMLWVNYTWNGDPNKILLWVKEDVKLNGAAAAVIVFMVYFILRNAITDPIKKGRFSAVYNIFAYVMLMFFTLVIPRLPEGSSLHPGNGGNPAFNMYDVSNTMRPIFYGAIIGWSLLGVWIASLRVRLTLLKNKFE